MLVLARRVNESIAIGESIVVTVLEIDGERVKLGISAPRDVLILRQEIVEAVRDQEKLQQHLLEEENPERFKALRDLLAAEGDDTPVGDEE